MEKPEPIRFAASDGTALAYYRFGTSGGAPTVLCHGLAAGAEQFFADAVYFAGKGRDVIVPDIRGHGASRIEGPTDPARFTIAALGADMVALLDHAGVGSVDWVGNSLGGIIAFGLLEGHSARFASLATFGTAHALNVPGFLIPAIPAAYRVLGPRLTGLIGAQGTTRHIPSRPLVARLLQAFDPRVGQAVAGHVRRYDLLETALAWPGPMLLIRGGRDLAVNRALEASLARFTGRTNFTRVDIAEAGHCANLDAQEPWRRALEDFWSRLA